MRVHTQNFKEKIKELGREIDSRITYGSNVINSEELYSISPVLNGDILKSVMKELDFESSIQVPLNTVVHYEFGLKINSDYEYLDYGDFIVYSSEYNEDTKTYHHVCYDIMLLSMKEYTILQNGTFPMTVRDYISNLCLDCNLVFKNSTDEFANYNKIIEKDIYANLGYTYRDIFDELSQVTASSICADIDNKIETRYISETEDIIDEEYLKNVNVKFGEKYGPINSIVLSRSAESDNVYLQDEESIANNGLCELKIIDNQIMNDNNRSNYLPDILEKLNGLEYYINDYSSTGILYYELCDKYTIQIGENTYNCVLFNDEQKITQGIVEDIYTNKPEISVTDYKKADKTDRKVNQVYIMADKQNQTIEALVSRVEGNEQSISRLEMTADSINSTVQSITNSNESNTESIEFLKEQMTSLEQTANDLNITITNINSNGVNKVVTSTGFVFDENGLSISKEGQAMNSLLDNAGLSVKRFDEDVLVANDQGVNAENITVRKYLIAGYHRTEKFDVNGEKRTGVFYVGGDM